MLPLSPSPLRPTCRRLHIIQNTKHFICICHFTYIYIYKIHVFGVFMACSYRIYFIFAHHSLCNFLKLKVLDRYFFLIILETLFARLGFTHDTFRLIKFQFGKSIINLIFHSIIHQTM